MTRMVLIGAGIPVFTRGLFADLISAPDLGGWELGLVDVNPKCALRRPAARGAHVRERGEGERIVVRGATDRTELLPGGGHRDLLRRVGGRPAWLRD